LSFLVIGHLFKIFTNNIIANTLVGIIAKQGLPTKYLATEMLEKLTSIIGNSPAGATPPLTTLSRKQNGRALCGMARRIAIGIMPHQRRVAKVGYPS
jgi:hypothetical protein